MNIEKLKLKLEHNKRRLQETKYRHNEYIKHCEDTSKNREVCNEYTKLSYHGGWEAGYLQGKISLIENILDDIEITNSNT